MNNITIKKIVCLVALCLAGMLQGADFEKTLTIPPGGHVSWSRSLQPDQDAELKFEPGDTPSGYSYAGMTTKTTHTNPGFCWTSGGKTFYIINTLHESAVATVTATCTWKPKTDSGSGGSGKSRPVITGTGTGTATAQPAVYWNSAAGNNVLALGMATEVYAYKNAGEEAPSSWSSSGGLSLETHSTYAKVTGTDASTEEWDANVHSVSTDYPDLSDDEPFTVVAVTGISADPEVVCIGGEIAYTITTQPEGFEYMVDYDPVDTSDPGIHEVTAFCGISSAVTTVTVVKVASVSCKDVTSSATDPGEDETVYVAVGQSNDTVTLIAAITPEIDVAKLPAGCPAWANADQDDENPLQAVFPIATPSSSAENTVITVTCGDAHVAIRVVVVRPDLEYDGLPEETEDPPNEENPGGFIVLNDNDNAGGSAPGEGDGVPDIDDDTPLAHADPDLKPVNLTLYPEDLQHGQVTLSVPDNLKAWADAKKNPTPLEWDLSSNSLPAVLYLEGYATGSGDLTLLYEHKDCSVDDTVKMNVLKIDSVEAYCDKFGASGSFGVNPEIFPGGEWDFGQPDQPPPYWWLPGTYANPSSQVLKVFFKYIKDANDEPAPFDIDLKANILPNDLSDEVLNITWYNWAGPSSSGSFDKTDEREVKFQNPTKGGLYKFRMEMELQPYHVITSDAWVLLPKAGGEIADWIVTEVPSLVTRASDWESDVRAVAAAHSLDGDEFLETAWIAIASYDFDYQGIVGSPTKRYSFRDADRPVGHVPDPSIPGMVGEKGNGDWDEPSYATLRGIVVHRAKVNNAMYAVWGRELGYTTAGLRAGAFWNAAGRGLWDDSTSQNAVTIGGDLYDAQAGGGSLSALLTKTRAKAIQSPDTPTGLNDVNLWPDPTPVSSGFVLPTMPRDYDSLIVGTNETVRGRLFN